MNDSIYNLQRTRMYLLDQIKDLTTEQLNSIPPGFNNNIIWHLGHLISSQQGLCYTRSSLPITVDDKYYTPYRPDTKPSEYISAEEVAKIKELLISTLDQLDKDFADAKFLTYNAFDNRYGVRLSDINGAIDFLPFHDGLHGGFITALKRVVNN